MVCTWIEVLWDYITYKIRQETIGYSKSKATERRATLASLEKKIKNCQTACDKDPSSKNLNNMDIPQTDYHCMQEFIALGEIVRSRANRYEKGKKSNKYFLNLDLLYKSIKLCIKQQFHRQSLQNRVH